MKQRLEIAAFLAVCIMVISFAIRAGQHHDNCSECKLAQSGSATENIKFVEACK